MKHIFIDENLTYYRANLHCHSTISDGGKSPEELKEFYKKRGYSVLAYTDHNVFITHNDLTDETFVALNGLEQQIYCGATKTCHLCFIALDPNNDICPNYHRRKWYTGNTKEWYDKVKFDGPADFLPVYTPECINSMIREGRERGFFVTYNHPTWSLESYPDYMSYDGMSAMEMVNFSCITSGYDDDNGRVYDDLLRSGKRLFCIAADDNHNRGDDCDSFGGYTMIGAKSLDYSSITSALERGDFWCAQGGGSVDGPELKSIVWDDEARTLTIRSSEVRRITMIANDRPFKNLNARNGETVSEAVFELTKPVYNYIRVVVTDDNGYKAYSNAYYIGDIK